ncbi:snare associated Golgi protein-domain-containing protein [Gamsiella multidivaricata]|uniref:snare associated Golgi protein-domain-containing protein n=1 Tax=Gamsiella multidivaricata TaxID=101098 RepID=UPI002220298F|nr:snare associated Golgi protein-domain-containing protein [Gamsiella multidivaricata]KAI7831560.1 snare associated Golgi protein-domain-containing protein [Gamsiella multidivaricata]
MQLGFLPRIVILIGLFGASLGGLYLLAQVLPPLSLPKSIDDVKVDAAILQEFATATYEGWIRTFWVFSVVYMWKQCFGIPGSAFLNILAGALYGPWFGTVLTSLLTTLGSVLAYFMSFFLMEPILNRYASSRLDQMRLQDQDESEEGTSLFMQLLLIRLFPLTPYWFINLASPLVGVPVVPFMTSMFLGCMPYNYICAQAGAILSEIHEMRDIYQQPWILFQVVLVLVLSGAAVIVSKRTKKKQVERDQRKSRKSEEEAVDDESTQHLLRSTFEIMERHQSQQAVDEERQRENIAMSSLDSQHASSHYGNKHDSAIVDMSNYRY